MTDDAFPTASKYSQRHVVEQTFAGGLTRDTLAEAYRMLGDEWPLSCLLNNITAHTLHADLKFGLANKTVLTSYDVRATVQAFLRPVRTGEQALVPYPEIYITIRQDVVPDDQLRILATDGRLYIFTFA